MRCFGTRRLHDRTGKEGDVVACRWCAASTRFCDGAEAGMTGAAIGAMSICRQAQSSGRAVVYLICSMAKLELTSNSSILPISFL